MTLSTSSTLLLAAALCAAGCGGSTPAPSAASTHAAAAPLPISDAIRAAVDAEDRSPDDRALDAGRHPAELLSFFHIAPGQQVAELFAGGGYTAELLARVVGPEGRVYGQNNAFLLNLFAEAPWAARLAKPVNARIVRVDRELDSPLPPEANDLDAVLLILAYHDTVWMHTDRTAMNRAIFQSLRSGGIYGIVDHSAREGDDISVVQTNHRIAESVVRDEILTAGFRLDGEGDFLRNPEDTRDWNASPRQAGERRGTSDRFVLRFIKP